MPARIWLILIALLILAAPAGDVVAEAADAVSYAAAADDDTATGATAAVTLDEVSPRVVQIPRVAATIRTTPALSRVFRPPRPAFD